MTDSERIVELRERLSGNLEGIDRMAVLEAKNALKGLLYGELKKTKDKNDPDKCKEMDDLALEIIQEGTRLIRKETLVNVQKLYEMIKECYQFRGRRYFRDFLIATEWNFDDDMKLYQIRRIVFDEWIEYLQDLEYARLRGLSISAPPRTGKALSMDSGILTPDGWKLMKDVHEGDYVIASDGKPAEVLGVFPQGVKDMYRVTFDDKTSVKCSGDHMWTVRTRDDRKNNKKRVVTTKDMLKNVLVEKGKRKNYTIDYVKPVEFNNTLKEDDLHPYLLGALLGDGYICHKSGSRIGFSSKDSDMIERIKKILPITDKIQYDRQCDYKILKKEDIRDKNGYPIKTTTANKLIDYGLYGKHSVDKFIPKKYLYSSIENRIELLRGLMDTDGYTDGSGTAEFASISKKLADDVTELARSLGGRVTRGQKIGKYKNKEGITVECNKVYRLYIKMPINPFWLKRKAEKYITRDKHIRKYKYICSIEKIPDEECQCIYVDHPEHLFVTDGYNLTHNTAIGTMFFMWCMLRHPEKSCFFVSHTAAMAKKVYMDILNYLTDEKKEIKSIFPEFEITGQNAEDLWIQLKRESSNPYHTAYFRGIDGNMAGILEASWLLYCDDLIKNIEEAMNPTRLETARTKYGVDITQRKANKGVRELHIATRWSTADVISSLENEFGKDPMWRFVRRPALNDDNTSNFMYEGDFALDTEYFMRQRNLPMMDEVSFSCIYQQEPIDREGLFVKEEDLKYYNGELPPSEPDFVGSACDVAWGGGDYLSMPIVKVYGTAVYVTDVVYNNQSKTVTKPIVMGKILNENVQKAYFEANNGGEEYGDDIKRMLKDEHNYKGLIMSEKAPGNKSKLTRILAAKDEIVGISPNFQLIFLDKEHRSQEYALFMKHVLLFNTSAKFQGKQKDDCVDSLSMIVAHILESRVQKASVKSEFSRGDLDI